MTYTVKAGDGETVCLWESDPIKAKLQEVRLVMETIKGSVPMFREFGCLDPKVLDKPMPVAEMMTRTMVREGVERWCRGVTVKGVSFQRDEKTGTLSPVVEVEIHAES